MKPTLFLIMIFLALPIQAYADWSGTAGMHPVLGPNLTQPRVEPQHHVQAPQPIENYTPRQEQYVRHNPPVRDGQPVKSQQIIERHDKTMPGYFRRDTNYYGYAQTVLPYADVDTDITVPDGFESIMVDGQQYYYNDGTFYQEVEGQLTAIPPVLGAVVDYIPQDYQIVMADGGHYLFTGGVYYQRVDQGFEVVQPPASDQE